MAGASTLFALGQILDSSNRLMVLFIFAGLCFAWVSFYVNINCDEQGVTVQDVTVVTSKTFLFFLFRNVLG